MPVIVPWNRRRRCLKSGNKDWRRDDRIRGHGPSRLERIVGQLSRAICSFVEGTLFSPPLLSSTFRVEILDYKRTVPAPGNPEKSAMQSTTNSFPFPSALLRSHRISRSFNFSPLPFVAYAYVQPFGLQLLISRHTLYTLCFVYHVRVFKFW